MAQLTGVGWLTGSDGSLESFETFFSLGSSSPQTHQTRQPVRTAESFQAASVT